VGSHNWTNQGTVANRDASLIIHHEEIAKYYEQVFLFDWDTLTRNPKPPKPKKTPGGDESVPAGPVATIRISAEALVPGD
jgi:phosphatidylserine/phosphatidylglycerophosphate/cardiolipin synthase-like enzyme